MTNNEFKLEQQAAIERMRKLSTQAKTQTKETFQPKSPSSDKNEPLQNKGFNLPFFESILRDGDTALIIGLLLLLMSENTDKKLLFALIYILI